MMLWAQIALLLSYVFQAFWCVYAAGVERSKWIAISLVAAEAWFICLVYFAGAFDQIIAALWNIQAGAH